MTTMTSQITSLTVVYSTVYSDADQRKHQSSASLAFCVGNSPGPVNSPHKGPVTRKMFPFDDVIMCPWNLVVKQGQVITSHRHGGMQLLVPALDTGYGVGTSYYITRTLWGAITCPCHWYSVLAQFSSYIRWYKLYHIFLVLLFVHIRISLLSDHRSSL